MAEHETVEEPAAMICTCDPKAFPYVTEPCPVHPIDPEKLKPAGVRQPFIVTDANLVDRAMVPFWGHLFNCPNCGRPIVIVSDSTGHFCPGKGCGVALDIQSSVVTSYIRGLS